MYVSVRVNASMLECVCVRVGFMARLVLEILLSENLSRRIIRSRRLLISMCVCLDISAPQLV